MIRDVKENQFRVWNNEVAKFHVVKIVDKICTLRDDDTLETFERHVNIVESLSHVIADPFCYHRILRMFKHK